jgi:hypothetical protein
MNPGSSSDALAALEPDALAIARDEARARADAVTRAAKAVRQKYGKSHPAAVALRRAAWAAGATVGTFGPLAEHLDTARAALAQEVEKHETPHPDPETAAAAAEATRAVQTRSTEVPA